MESSARVGRGRWSAKRKVSVVPEVLCGEDLETAAVGTGDGCNGLELA